MVKKLDKSHSAAPSGPHLAGTVKESASQIWLAGLGAFAKAQEEGGKVFEALVKEGLSIQRKTQAVAEEKITEATSRVSGMATDIASKATGQWDKLEGIFEDRVAKALGRLGVPSAADIDALVARVDALSQSLTRLGAGVSKTAIPTAPRAPARKTAAKPATKRGKSSKTP